MHSSYPVIITLHWSKAHCHTATWRSLLCNRRMPAWPPAAPTKARQTFLWPSRPLLSAARSKISRSEWPWVLLRDRQREKIPNPIALMIETKHGAPADHRLQTWDWVCCHAYLPVASLKIWTHLFFFFIASVNTPVFTSMGVDQKLAQKCPTLAEAALLSDEENEYTTRNDHHFWRSKVGSYRLELTQNKTFFSWISWESSLIPQMHHYTSNRHVHCGDNRTALRSNKVLIYPIHCCAVGPTGRWNKVSKNVSLYWIWNPITSFKGQGKFI